MTAEWKARRDSSFPRQTWRPFPADAIVEVSGHDRTETRIGVVSSFWWGWADGLEAGSVIQYARRLDIESQG